MHIVSLKEQGDTTKAMQLVDLILADNPDNYDASMQKALFLLEKDSSLARIVYHRTCRRRRHEE